MGRSTRIRGRAAESRRKGPEGGNMTEVRKGANLEVEASEDEKTEQIKKAEGLAEKYDLKSNVYDTHGGGKAVTIEFPHISVVGGPATGGVEIAFDSSRVSLKVDPTYVDSGYLKKIMKRMQSWIDEGGTTVTSGDEYGYSTREASTEEVVWARNSVAFLEEYLSE